MELKDLTIVLFLIHLDVFISDIDMLFALPDPIVSAKY